MRNRDVAEAFAAGQACSAGNLRTDGQTVWSYGTVIADRTGGVVALNTRRYSVSTSRHQSLIRAAVSGQESTVDYVGPEARMWRSWRDGLTGRARP